MTYEEMEAALANATVTSLARAPAPSGRDALIVNIMKGLAPFIHDLEKQITALQKRVQELEQRPELKYLGTFRDDGRKYSAGSAVTCDGGIWIALKATTERPNHSADWQLAVKSGAATAHARNGSTLPPAQARE